MSTPSESSSTSPLKKQPSVKRGQSRWNSMFSGAIAGLESRLDTILADDSQASARSRLAEQQQKERDRLRREQGQDGGEQAADEGEKETIETAPNASQADSTEYAPSSRPETPSTSAPKTNPLSPSRTRANGPLAERLSRAVAGDQRSKRQPGSSVTSPPRVASPTLSEPSQSQASQQDDPNLSPEAAAAGSTEVDANAGLSPSEVTEDDSTNEATRLQVSSADNAQGARVSLDSARSINEDLQNQRSHTSTPSIAMRDTAVESSQSPHEAEIDTLRETVDALQAKVSYLAKAASESAQLAADEASPGSLERKIAEQDDRIAQLMDEGQRLSKGELNQMTAIKKLRVRVADDEKITKDLRAQLERAEKGGRDATERAKRAEAAERSQASKVKASARLDRELQELKADVLQRQTLENELRRQLGEAEKSADDRARELKAIAAKNEAARAKELEEKLEDMRLEKKLAEDRAKNELKSHLEQAAREKEMSQVAEDELKQEIMALETKLEVLRSRTEEAAGESDSQVKLLRQIETLQTQYALAGENWQGIESSLNSRLVALEQERDDLARREADIRRKARELSSNNRTLESEVETLRESESTLQSEAEEREKHSRKLMAKLAEAESAVTNQAAEATKEREALETRLQRKLDEERAKLRIEYQNVHAGTPGPMDNSNPMSVTGADSPRMSMSGRKSSAKDPQGLGLGLSDVVPSRRISSRGASVESPNLTRPTSQRHDSRSRSGQRTTQRGGPPPAGTPTLDPPSRQNSLQALTTPYLNGGGRSGTPSIAPLYDDEPDNDAATASSPHHPTASFYNNPADLLSMATVSAGPSVQLVERMSAAVRRLESEKAASRDELGRLTEQRDEARDETVRLMSELDKKVEVEAHAAKMEKELRGLDERYQTTLEMLGEKSELVDELRNDIEDLKKMYRDLVERTVPSGAAA